MTIKPKDIIAKMKEAMKTIKKETTPPPAHLERDMRQEAMDMGAHGAKEFFGNKDV